MAARGWALVTGGARRIGADISRDLAEAGYSVAIHYHRSEAAAHALVDEIADGGGEAVAYAADLSQGPDCTGLAESVWQELGSIELLVNNAGVLERSELAPDLDAFDRAIDLNLRAPYLLSLEMGPRMVREGRGSIVNIASTGGFVPYVRHVPYSLSKAALLMLTKSLAKGFAPSVRVNAVAPGSIQLEEGSDKRAMGPLDRIPLGRYGSGRDVARAVRFLAAAEYMTGQCLIVDGGRSIGL